MIPEHRFSTAPMMEWTDRHWRMFARQLTRRALLYTEMVTAQALVHGNLDYLTAHHPDEYPLALQIGGSDPEVLRQATERVRALGFCEINLNLGCPSDRVRAGCFGAALMADPERVSDCLMAMQNGSGSKGPEITAKIRLGIDDQPIEETLPRFVEMLRRAGIARVIVHARIAILGGLSPKQNRDIPPLRYDLVHALKRQFPDLKIILNGGLNTLTECQTEGQGLDGVMVGRAAYHNPQLLMSVDPLMYHAEAPHQNARDALLAYRPYVESQLQAGFPLKHLSRHLVGLYHLVPGARRFRQVLSEEGHRPGADWGVIARALDQINHLESHDLHT